MSKGKINSGILPAERIPKGPKQSSGKTKFNRMHNSGLKGSQSLAGLPKKHAGISPC
jgi:hypothetical protein